MHSAIERFATAVGKFVTTPTEQLDAMVVVDRYSSLLSWVADRTERAAMDCLGGDQRKEAFDQVEPRTLGGNEIHVPAGGVSLATP